MVVDKKTTVPSVKFSRRHGTRDPTGSDAFHEPTKGSLHLSKHHIIFEREQDVTRASRPGADPETTTNEPSGEQASELWIPLSLLHSVTRSPPTFTGSPTPLVLRSRDFYTYSIELPTAQDVDDLFDTIKALCSACSSGGIENRWAFFHQTHPERPAPDKTVGWDIYNPQEEFARMGVGSRSKAWRFSDINADFNFCPSYPAQIVVPARISDTTLTYAVKYRSKCRIPGLVYLHWANQGSITRSSQPMVGITQTSRSIQDEKLIEAIFSSHSQHSGSREAFTVASAGSSTEDAFDAGTGGIVYGATATNVIIDARPTKNAYANSVKGAGTENMTFYKNCKKEYLGIDNIHVMRSSLNGVFQALADAETTGHLDRMALRRTNWLSHLTNILDGVLIVIRTIHLSNSHVLVHCSDGWDRTSQLSALPQICLDPFYRTARGLAILIEKDWIAYGHKFTDRSGHLCNDRVEFQQKLGEDATTQQSFLASVQKQFASSSHAFKETCPVFQQFLDCIYQIQRQFPDRFEWNETLLRKLVWETYSGKSGSFLFNSEVDRATYRARERTKSVWETVFDVSESNAGGISLKPEFRNPRYNPSLDDPESKLAEADQGVLMFDPQRVKYWHELFGRSDEEMNWSPPVSEQTLVTQTEQHEVTSPENDPVLHPLSSRMPNLALDPAPSSSSFSSQLRTSTFPEASRPTQSRDTTTHTPQPQLADTVASVQKLGWSAWKSVQKFGQEAAKQYKERSITDERRNENLVERGDSHDDRTSASSSRREELRGADPERTGSGSGSSSSMWSRLSTLSNNPWQQPLGPTTQLDQPEGRASQPPPAAASSPPIAYVPYQPRKPPQLHSEVQPRPVRQASSALSINPWETISQADALPTPAAAPTPSTSQVQYPSTGNVEHDDSRQGGASDPLGVGGF
ncbi:phosphatidylinositol-3-phosphatase YMR1 [Sporobolomyces koalae]|uniref:phosphatidylinositol-3-phosphatase YMR1 n=1 Tax=Sporobolomyces koalae TaxID=500713 RepID=UPI003182B2C4